MKGHGILANIADRQSIITAIDNGIRFPEVVTVMLRKYSAHIDCFSQLIAESKSSAELLGKIRDPGVPKGRRMALLKMFRRCVSGVCDTEATKKVTKVSTQALVDAYGHTFTPIQTLKAHFRSLDASERAALAVLIGEYDNRGEFGYVLTGQFFDWFESSFKDRFVIEGPRGAGRDVELSSVLDGFDSSCPCDFIIRRARDRAVLGIGFARYDSTRGGAQSDDRTGGNKDKVAMIRSHCTDRSIGLKIVFLADGPGLAHEDTWREACALDSSWDDRVRVITLKTAASRLTEEWLVGKKPKSRRAP